MTGSRSDTRSAGRKPRLGEIATPGRVCPPHNETYDCRIRPNGIGCLRRRSTRRRLGCRPAARPAGQEPVFRADSASERNDLPIRSARFPIRANGKPRRAAIPATRRKTREKREGERRSPSGRRIHPEAYRTPGRQNQNAVGGRAERPRVRLGLAEPGSEEGSCDRSPGSTDRPFPTETPDEPGISVKHSSTPKPKI